MFSKSYKSRIHSKMYHHVTVSILHNLYLLAVYIIHRLITMLSLRVIQHHHHRYRYLKSSVTFFDNVIMSSSKRQCLVIKIGTHNGCFHCDDAMACAMLLMIDEYKSAIIVRLALLYDTLSFTFVTDINRCQYICYN